jgi:hypothetical protein
MGHSFSVVVHRASPGSCAVSRFSAAGLAAPQDQQPQDQTPPVGSDDWWKLLQAARFSGQS